MSELARFMAKVAVPIAGSNCWKWIGAKKRSGYGNFYMHGPKRLEVPTMNTTNIRNKLFITTQWGKMRICPTCPNESPGDNEWFTDQFNGRTCRACLLEALEKKRRAQGMKKGRGGVPTLDARESDELCARYKSGGITQQDLSEQFGISRRTVARILSGETRAGQAA